MAKPTETAKTKQQPAPSQAPKPTTKVGITLHGREYIVACDAGDEKKLGEIVKLVDAKISEIANKGPSSATETRLFMMACLMLADELIETRKAATEARKGDEDLYVAAVEHLRGRIISIANQVGRA